MFVGNAITDGGSSSSCKCIKVALVSVFSAVTHSSRNVHFVANLFYFVVLFASSLGEMLNNEILLVPLFFAISVPCLIYW